MSIPAAMRARQPESAARTAVPIMVVCAVVLGCFSFGAAADTSVARLASWAAIAVLAGLTAAFTMVPAARLDRAGAVTALGLLGVVLVCAMNWVTRDPSAAGQAFLCFPVLWAAAHLRRAAVALVTAAAVLGDAAVLFGLLPFTPALTDLGFFGTVLVVVGLMLVRAEEAREVLVTALHQQATSDSLTGLANRRVLDDALRQALAEPAGSPGTGLVLVDVDAFKSINDQHGHPVGDDALMHLAAVLRSVVRSSDAVLSRMGGDELAVLLLECPAEVAVRRAEEVLDAVRSSPLELADGTLLALSVSLGVAHAPSHAEDLEQLYAAADAALYAAKRGGRGRVGIAG